MHEKYASSLIEEHIRSQQYEKHGKSIKHSYCIQTPKNISEQAWQKTA